MEEKRSKGAVKREVNDQFGRKINQDANENGELFWNELDKIDVGKAKKLQQDKR